MILNKRGRMTESIHGGSLCHWGPSCKLHSSSFIDLQGSLKLEGGIRKQKVPCFTQTNGAGEKMFCESLWQDNNASGRLRGGEDEKQPCDSCSKTGVFQRRITSPSARTRVTAVKPWLREWCGRKQGDQGAMWEPSTYNLYMNTQAW